MKKIVFFMVSLFLMVFSPLMISCGGGTSSTSNNTVQEKKPQAKQEPMQYTVSVDENFVFPVDLGDRFESGANFRVFECTENGDKIYQNDFVVLKGSSKTFTAQPNVQKVKVYLSFLNILDPRDKYEGWLPLVYYLTPNENKEIHVDLHVELSRFEP